MDIFTQVFVALCLGVLWFAVVYPAYWLLVAFTLSGIYHFLRNIGAMEGGERFSKTVLCVALAAIDVFLFFTLYGYPPKEEAFWVSVICAGGVAFFALPILINAAWFALPFALFLPLRPNHRVDNNPQ